MLHKRITHNLFFVFSLYSLCLSLVFSIFVIQQMQAPIVFADEFAIPVKHIVEKSTSILIFGDMMLDRAIREQTNENGTEYPFELIKDMLSSNDIVVANAEGSFSFFDSVTVGKKGAPLNFTFDPMFLPTLKNLGFTLLGQANNHALNFGIKGLIQSTTSITIAGLNYFGDPSNKDVAPYIKEVNKEKIGFIAYNEFSYQGLDNVISKIKEVRNNVSYLVVYPHWGDEYNPSFTESQQKVAHEFIDAGADVVIGTHPHVIEPVEFYKNKPIFYSIGNFVFDQAEVGPTTEGLAIKIILKRDSVIYEIDPLFIKFAQVSPMDNESRQNILNTLSKSVINPDDSREYITTGSIEISR